MTYPPLPAPDFHLAPVPEPTCPEDEVYDALAALNVFIDAEDSSYQDAYEASYDLSDGDYDTRGEDAYAARVYEGWSV